MSEFALPMLIVLADAQAAYGGAWAADFDPAHMSGARLHALAAVIDKHFFCGGLLRAYTR
jgi:hypothetical protein